MKRFVSLPLLLLAACASLPPEPVLPRLRDAANKPTVILVPGATGVTLRDAASGRIVWGDARSFFLPHDDGYSMARPIAAGARQTVVPGDVIREIRLGGYRKEVYGTLFRLMEANGVPFIAHAYDWREDNVVSARVLAQRAAARGRVVLLCQSNAASICRYASKYGDVSLDEAERGIRRVPPGIEKVILVGSSNGGAIRILKELDRGRRYLPLVGRRLRPETVFTFPALYFDLPSYGSSWLVDESGAALALDLYDASTWVNEGWSIFDPSAARRAPESIFGTAEERIEYLRGRLADARRLQRLLQQSVRHPLPKFYSIQSRSFPTPERALVRRGKLYFAPDRAVMEIPAVRTAASAPGDRHATAGSQVWLGEDEKAAMARPHLFIDERHFEMITDRRAQAWILEFLAE